jgi:hypothetical protein
MPTLGSRSNSHGPRPNQNHPILICIRSAVGINSEQTDASRLGLVRLHRIAPGIIPVNQSLYKLEKQSGSELFRPTNPT